MREYFVQGVFGPTGEVRTVRVASNSPLSAQDMYLMTGLYNARLVNRSTRPQLQRPAAAVRSRTRPVGYRYNASVNKRRPYSKAQWSRLSPGQKRRIKKLLGY